MFFVQIGGHIGKKPEARFTPSGQKVTSFNVATTHRKSKDDVATVWVRVTVWGDRLDKLMTYLDKGSAVLVSGKMNPPSSYVDKEGKTQFSLEMTAELIEFSPFGKSERAPDAQGSNSSANSYQSKPSTSFGNASASESSFDNSMDEEPLPF